MGGKSKLQALKDLVTQNRPSIVFLCETKIKEKVEFLDLTRALGFQHSHAVLSVGRSGGLGLFWRDDVTLRVRSSSARFIDAEVGGGPGEPRWRLTGFYGHPKKVDRFLSWQTLCDLSDEDTLPWVTIGDFNEIVHADEKLGGRRRLERQMEGFREALGYGDLIDLGFLSAKYTWSNSLTKLRLDRAAATPTWSDIFGYSRVRHLPPSISDHIPLLLQARLDPIPKHTCYHRFRFESFWVQNQECEQIVRSSWSLPNWDQPMFNLTRKIQSTSKALDKWQRSTFRARQDRMLVVRNRLGDIMDLPITPALQEEKNMLTIQLQQLITQEEAYWSQRAKVTWLKEGDRNTSYFHRKASNRQRKNTIHGLFDEGGKWCDDAQGMESVITSYFSKIFTAGNLNSEAVSKTLEAIQPCVTPEMNQQLCAPYSSEEVRIALFQMFPTKSPGPDGLPPLFYQHYWETIGEDLTLAVKNFLHSGQLLKQINFTHICLIPKVKNPQHMADLRPIALCNVIYKICSKVIANRLKLILPHIISPFQSAFVPGRLITDNTLVANEFAHFIHNKRSGDDGYMALKLDLSKAYDRMEWTFLRQVMERFGFSTPWVDMVMQCVTSVRYSFLVRGKPCGYVIPQRGLRQGDPLSPYLFLLGVEGFSALLSQQATLGLLPGISICEGAPSVNHLLFADDSMLYAESSLAACMQIRSVISTYGEASGQLVNFSKSSIVFSKNVEQSVQTDLARFLEVEIVTSHERYLGLPTYVGRAKTETFQYLKERLDKKIQGWQGKLLSGAGKDILIRVVAQALPNYAMSCFLLTKSFCDDLQQKCAKFWWGSSTDKKKIHWKKWSDLCLPRENGGMGFRNLYAHNLAMLAKQLWRVLENPSSLVARIYKARYFPHHSFWDAPESIAPSYSWRSIIASKELVLKGMRWQVGDGSSIHTWSDPWIPRAPSFIPDRRGLNVELDSRVKDFITPSFNWDIQYLNQVFTPEDVGAILSISLSDRPAVDRCIWHYDPKGQFTVKSAYKLALSLQASHTESQAESNDDESSVQFWKEVWHANIPASAKVCIWKACQAILPTKDRLLHRHVNIADLSCPLCSDALETTTHLCFECPFTKALIEAADPLIHQVCLSPNVQFPSFKGWLQVCFASLSKPSFHKLLFLVWAVWKERNNRTWREKSSTVGDVCFQANAWLHDFQFHQVKKGTAQVSRIATWKPPSAGWFKVNFDGAFSKQTHMGGVGVIIRDSEGSCMGGMFQHIENVYSPEQIEAVAGRIAVRMVQSKNLAPISFETDSLNLACFVNQSSGSITSTYGRLYEDISAGLSSIPRAMLGHISRDGNAVAHSLAKFALHSGQQLCWDTIPPLFIQDALVADCNLLQ